MKEMVEGIGRYKSLIIILLILTSHVGICQDYSPLFWFTGPTEFGITFRKSDFSAQLDSIQNTSYGNGGGTVGTNPSNGDLMFYSDGDSLYDGSHQLIQSFASNSWTLFGNRSGNQPAAACAIPGQPDQYLIISNSATTASSGTIFRANIDMVAQGNATAPQPPLGNTLMPVNTPITNVSEGMVIIANPGGTGYWLITHQRGTSSFNVTPITSSGLNVAVSTTYDFTTNGMPTFVASNISWHGSGKIAVSPQDTARNVHILDFSNVTGLLTYDTAVFNSAVTDINSVASDNYAVYDSEWSPDGTLLYISRYGSDGGTVGMVYVYDLTTPQATIQPILSNPVYRSYGLQAGPDSLIYHLYRETIGGPILTGRIGQDTTNQIYYEPQVFGNTDFGGRQFPATLPYQQPQFTSATFRYIGTCYGTATKFYPVVEPPPTNIRWTFGDGTISNEIAPIHQYTQPQIYNVTMRATINGIDSIYSESILIIQSDTVVLNSETGTELPQDTTICQDEILILDATAATATSYTWSHSEFGNSPTAEVDTAGYYWVVAEFPVSGGSGTCTSYDAINVTEYDYQLQVANHWYFGNQADLDFNETPPVPVGNSQMIAPEGCTAISDRNGKILFYTNGEFAYGRTGNVIGDNIGGETGASQSAIGIPFPGDETMYYIFTTEEVYGLGTFQLNYGILDIKEKRTGNSDPGDVVLNDLPLFTKNTERLTAIGGYGQNAVLVSHEYGNNTFQFYPITDQGIGRPRLNSIGSVHDLGSPESAQGYMRFSGDGSKLAVALAKDGRNYIELFEMDSSQNLSNYIQVEFPAIYPYPQFQAYGVEFSPGSNKLFVTLKGTTSKLFEMRVDTLNLDTIMNSMNSNLAAGFENNQFGALQLGPDGQIYMAVNGSATLPYISPNDQVNVPSIFNPTGVDLAGKTSALGLPNFVQNQSSSISGYSATVNGLCVGQPSNFVGQQTSNIDMYSWTVTRISDTTTIFTSTNLTDTYTFQQAGNYGVAFHLYNRCGLDTTIDQTITIKDPPSEPTMPDVASICTGDLQLQVYNTSDSVNYAYQWNDASTNNSNFVSSPAIYSVTIFYLDPQLNGCINQDTVFVAEGRPQFDLGPDITVCETDNIPDFNTFLNPVDRSFDWRINGNISSETGPTHPVDTSVPNLYMYTLEVYDSLTTCINNDTVTVSINNTPSVSYTPTNSTCGSNNGEVVINGNPDNATLYLEDTGGSQTMQLDSLSPGSYILIAQDPISGCLNNYSVVISDNVLTVTVDTIPDCTNGELQINFTPEIYPLDYSLIGVDNSNDQSGTIMGPDPNPAYAFNIQNVDPGTYNLEISSGGCLDVTPNIVMPQKPTAIVDVNQTYTKCGDDAITIIPDQITSTPGPYRWADPSGTSFSSNVLQTTVEGIWTVEYLETATLCSYTTTFEIIRYEYPDVEIVQNGDGCGTAILLVAQINNPEPGNTFSYLWDDGTVAPARTLPAPASGTSQSYIGIAVTVADQQSGCAYTTSPEDFETFTDYSVFLTSDPACDDGEDIRIVANILNIPATTIETYLWSGPEDGIEDLNQQSIKIQEEGMYAVNTDWNGCENNASLVISRNPVTISGYNDSTFIICPEPPVNEVKIINVTQFVFYSLYDIVQDLYVDQIDPGIYELYQESIYAGAGLNSFGCFSYDTMAVVEDCVPEVYAPNAFSPDAIIEKNQTFSIDGLFIGEEFEIKIYNRWGELVYVSEDKNFKWDGTSNSGVMLSGGTYAYVIRYKSATDPEKGIFEKRGGITLLR
ncbi:gliding motility-associated C-terminal domain-containing protein [Bacteroidota bacterium]